MACQLAIAASNNSPDTFQNFDYGTLRTALSNTAVASGDPAQLAAVAGLPASDPIGSGYEITSAEAKALGLFSGDPTASDGTVSFNSSLNWSYGTPNVPPPSGHVSLIPVAMHEITEIMGRLASVGTDIDGDLDSRYTLMDLFRYYPGSTSRDTSTGTASPPSNANAVFSYDNGKTDLGYWNNDPSKGDLGDWGNGPAPGGHDAFGGTGPGVLNYLTMTDVTLMNVLGWDTAFLPGEVSSGVTEWVDAGQSSAGIVVLSAGYMEV